MLPDRVDTAEAAAASARARQPRGTAAPRSRPYREPGAERSGRAGKARLWAGERARTRPSRSVINEALKRSSAQTDFSVLLVIEEQSSQFQTTRSRFQGRAVGRRDPGSCSAGEGPCESDCLYNRGGRTSILARPVSSRTGAAPAGQDRFSPAGGTGERDSSRPAAALCARPGSSPLSSATASPTPFSLLLRPREPGRAAANLIVL